MKSASTYILRECGVERMIDVPFDFDIEGAKLLRNIIGIMFCLETPEMLEKVITDLREGPRLRGSSALRLEEIIAELEQKEKDAAKNWLKDYLPVMSGSKKDIHIQHDRNQELYDNYRNDMEEKKQGQKTSPK